MKTPALLIGVIVAFQGQVRVPSEADIPKPVPATTSLAGSNSPDIARFLNVRVATQPSLSPDGRRLTFQTSITGAPQLWVADATGGWPDQLTFGEAVTFHEWSPVGEWIVYGSDQSGNEREGYYLITPDGTKERELLAPSDAYRVFGAFTRDGQHIAYATSERNGRDFDIHLIEVASGADREVYRGRMGLLAASWRPDASAVILTELRGEDANDVYMLDVASGKLEVLFKPEIASRYDSFSWLPDGSGFYLITNEGREFQALGYYDLARRSLRIVEAPEGEVEHAGVSHNGEILAWIVDVGGYSQLRARHLKTGKELQIPALPQGKFELRWAPRASVAAISVSGPQVPGDVWTWNPETGALHRATRSATAGLDMGAMVVPTHHSFRAVDGTTLHGLLYLPRQPSTGSRLPVVLSVHGGPTGHATPRFNPTHQYLLTRGIAIFDFNYRGSTGYGKTYARLNDRRLRVNELYDLRDAVTWLRQRKDIDGGRVAIMGGSYGGYLTMAALARLPDMFASGIAFVGVSDWITAFEGTSPMLQASDRIEYGDVKNPGDREFFRHLSPITHVDKVRAPAMLVHGANDPRDPVSQSDDFVRAIRTRGGTAEYLRFPDEGHSVRKLSNRIILYRRVAAFLERTLALKQ